VKIWIDADAAPRDVKELVFRAAKRLEIGAVLVANQRLHPPAGNPMVSAVWVDGGPDVADQHIVDTAEPGDLVVTQDIPLAALLVPRGILWWNAVPARVYLLEGTGAALALWAFIGLVVLIWRRVSVARIRQVSTPMDVVVLLLLALQVATGLWTAASFRFGSSWFAGVMTPYLWSLLTLRPRPELLADLAWPIKVHITGFFVLLAVFPFSRLIHMVTLPLGYLVRPWQIVVWTQKRRGRGRA